MGNLYLVFDFAMDIVNDLFDFLQRTPILVFVLVFFVVRVIHSAFVAIKRKVSS